jgi:phosphohistidine phosphatase SixA
VNRCQSIWIMTAIGLMAFATGLYAENLEDGQLALELRRGGYVLVMRHANSPLTPPDKPSADPENVSLERQLDETGRTTAIAMGDAIKQLHIPLGQVFSSPTYRALETVRLAALGSANPVAELDIGSLGMKPGGAADPRATWLRGAVAVRPPLKSNTVIVTHAPNIVAAFPESAAGLAEGETFVFRPDGKGSAVLVARIKIEDWPRLAQQSR